MSDASAIIIEEITGPKRKLEMRGPALPHKGTTWEEGQKVKTIWYPGNKRATQQVLGPTFMPSSWEGMWRRSLMTRAPSLYTDEQGRKTKVTAPHFMREVLSNMSTIGSLLRVVWSTATGVGKPYAITREGRLLTIKTPIDTIHDIGWTLNFEWVGEGGNTQRIVSTREGDYEANHIALMAELNELLIEQKKFAFVNATELVPKSASNITLGQLEAFADYPIELINDFVESVEDVAAKIKRATAVGVKLVNSPIEVANALTGASRKTIEIGDDLYRTITRIPSELFSKKSTPADIVRAYIASARIVESEERIAREAHNLEMVARARMSANPGGPGESVKGVSSTQANALLDVYTTKEGDTPVKLSVRYYGTPDRAIDILKANKLPWNMTAFDPGKILIIPSQGLKAY